MSNKISKELIIASLNNEQKRMILDMMSEGYYYYQAYWENERWVDDDRSEQDAVDDMNFAGDMEKIMEELLGGYYNEV